MHDYERMLSWAERQLEGLEASITGYFRKHPTVLRHEYDVATEQTIVRYAKRTLPEEGDWPFQIGDAIHASRSALDYLAFHIVTKHPHVTKIKQIAFPIVIDSANYPGTEGRTIGEGVPDPIRDAIKGLQPYHRAHALECEPLAILDELENIHKHRRLLIAGIAVTSITVTGESPKIELTLANMPAGPIENNTELYRYRILDPTHAKDDVQIRIASHVSFNESGLAKGLKVMRVIEDIQHHIRNVVFPVLAPYV